MTAKKYTEKEIEQIQEELCKLGIFERFTDYRISEKYLNDFLDNLEKKFGKRDYIVRSQLIPLFNRIKEKFPRASEKELVNKAHKLIPFIRALFHREKVLPIIKKAIRSADKDTKD